MATISEAFAIALGHHQAARLDAAEQIYRQILAVEPNHADAWHLLGVAHYQRGNHQVSADYIRTAIGLNANVSVFHFNLGNVHLSLQQWDEAVACYRRTLKLKPDFPEAHNNLGNALQEQGKLDEAVVCFRRAVELNPSYAEAYNNLGSVFRELDKRDESLDCFRRALEVKPDYAAALGALTYELQHHCQWEGLNKLSLRVVEVVDQGARNVIVAPVSPFCFLSLPTITTAQQQLRCAQQWEGRQRRLSAELGRNLAASRPSGRQTKLTIGYLSCDFHTHATAMLTAELFEKHDRDRFAIVGYSCGRDDGSPLRQRLENGFDVFVDLKDASFINAARRISTDGVDILVDLKGYAQDARTQILALRPAPIQVNYLGYPGTMGASFVDYILVDDFVVPPEEQPFYTEKLVHLPGCYQVNDSRREISERTPARAECGLPEEGFVFCCFNNNYKLTPEVFGVWMKLLKAVPGSVLWLLEGNPFAAANLRREALARGVAAERLVFAPRLPLADHLARHRLADLFLDTVPVNAHTTASEALWTGCPVLTIAGETFVSRVAGSLLRTLGLPELIATSLDEYAALALRLATDAKQLAQLRARLQTNRTTSPLFDAGQFAGPLEQAYKTMWRIHASGEKPCAFRVGPT